MTSSPDPEYARFADALRRGGYVTDPWYDGAPRFRVAPLVVSRVQCDALARVGEGFAAVCDELQTVACADPELTAQHFALTPTQRALWAASMPLWHGIARADVFDTAAGLVVAEINCDTPTGEPEAVELSRLAGAAHPDAIDPNAMLAGRFVAMAEALATSSLAPGFERAAAIVYPTDCPEDLSLVRLYSAWLTRAGWRVTRGSPYNLRRRADGALTLFDAPVSLVVRHYKTDWWTERVSAWRSETIPDAAPLHEPLRALVGAGLDGRCAVLNPFGALVPQNKRAMAFLWEHLARFSAASQDFVRRHVPYTARLEALDEATLRTERERWVIKSAYGAEGDEVLIGRDTPPEHWALALAEARPGHWVAQERFEAVTDAAGESVNWGVFVVAGEFAGLYARTQRGATDVRARSVPVLVRG
jgi:glutathionylspermidine synthase